MPRQKSRKERNKILKFSTKRNSEDVIGNIDVTVFKISSAYNTFIFLSIAFKCIYCLEAGITKQGCIYKGGGKYRKGLGFLLLFQDFR